MMSIGEVSNITGVSKDRIRNYGEENLIEVYTDPDTNYRYYEEKHIDEINFIALLQEVGLKIKEIKLIIDFMDRKYKGSIEEHLNEVAEILTQYDNSNHSYLIQNLLDDLIMDAYDLSNEEYKTLTTPFATMTDDRLKKDMYIFAANHYIAEYIIKLNIKPEDAHNYFLIALNNKIQNSN